MIKRFKAEMPLRKEAKVWESIQKDDPNPDMSEWVEELERQRALFGERVIYVSAQLFW